MPDARTWIAALRSSHDRLVSLTTPLSPGELARGSYCSEWTIAQVLSHLGSSAEIFQLFLDAALTGASPPGADAYQPIWDVWNARSPQEQAAEYRRSDAAFVERFESLDDSELARMHLTAIGMELDAAGLASLRLSEHALHTWDVAVALDGAAELAPDAVELIIDTVGRLIGRVGKPQGERINLRVRTTQPERDLILSVGDDVRLTGTAAAPDAGARPGAEAGPDAAAAPEAELHIPSAAFIRLVYGRLDPAHTPSGTEARGVTLDSLRAVFPGF
jgi:uncharacterized protein (TIGR03083 family)